jgi:hypothetical protein
MRTTFCRSGSSRPRRPGADALDGNRDFVADRINQGIVEDVELPARCLVEQVAESGDPVLAGKGCAMQHRFCDSGPQESLELNVTAEFFDAKIRRIDLMRIDQRCRNAGAALMQISAPGVRLMHQPEKMA